MEKNVVQGFVHDEGGFLGLIFNKKKSFAFLGCSDFIELKIKLVWPEHFFAQIHVVKCTDLSLPVVAALFSFVPSVFQQPHLPWLGLN